MWKKEYLIDWKLREVILDNFPQNTKQILPQHKGWQSLFLCTYRLHFKTVKLTIFTQRINFQNFYEISFRKMQQLKNNMTHLEHSTPMWDPSGELIIRHTVGFWQTSIRKKKRGSESNGVHCSYHIQLTHSCSTLTLNITKMLLIKLNCFVFMFIQFSYENMKHNTM